jgi:uncharacterized protein
MRGFLLGLLWGIIALSALAAAISLLSPLPSRPNVDTRVPGNTSQSADPASDSGVKPAGQDADLVGAAPTVPADSSSSGDLASMESADTDSGARPVVGGETTLTDPDNGDSTRAETGTVQEAPVAGTSPDALGQGQTAPDDLDVVAQTSTSRPEVGGTSKALSGPTDGDTGVDVMVNSDTPVAPQSPGAALSTPLDDTQVTPSDDPTAQPVAPSTQGTTLSAPPDDTQVALSSDPAQPIAPPVSDGGSGFGADVSEPTSADPYVNSSEPADEPSRTAALPQAGSQEDAKVTPRIGTPVVPLTERGTGQSETPDTVGIEPPIVRYSEPFSNPDDKPLMSIILIDDDKSIGVEALANFPQPLTMAVDPSAPDAAEKMARHRAAGFEVVSLIDLPKGATAQDAEVTLTASFAAMPEVVAVLEGPNSGIQGNRSLADQVSTIVASTGHGVIMQENGLNTVYKLAARDGIPAGLVFRDFDGAGQSGRNMRRFLDQAAFRAGQDGAVIMLGRIRPETISTLLLWALQDRASRIALAPVSAVLIRDEAQ